MFMDSGGFAHESPLSELVPMEQNCIFLHWYASEQMPFGLFIFVKVIKIFTIAYRSRKSKQINKNKKKN